MVWVVGIWAVMVGALFFGSFFSTEAATIEPFGRYLYMVALAACVAGVTLGLMRAKRIE